MYFFVCNLINRLFWRISNGRECCTTLTDCIFQLLTSFMSSDCLKQQKIPLSCILFVLFVIFIIINSLSGQSFTNVLSKNIDITDH